MTFALPHLLWLVLLPVALLAWEVTRARRLSRTEHPKIIRAEAGLRTVTLSAEGDDQPRGARRRFLLCAGLALGVVALARPQWGRLDEPVFDQSREIVIALDLSRSMLTPDIKPSRLERSKLLIQSLLDHLKGERVGLVVFSGTAFLQSPISADYEILREFLPSLGPDFLPEGGTNYRQLIDTSLEAFGDSASADRYLIILSDGEATDDNWRDRIPDLEKKGIRVIGLGVGTRGGGMIPDGSGGFMKDENGAVVMSKLEGDTLRDLAAATHGTYRDASDWVDLAGLVSATVDAGKKGKFVEHNTVRYAERYQWALAQALACLAASFWLEFPVRPKSREIRLNAPAAPKARAAAAVAALLMAGLLLASTAFSAGPEGAPDPAATLSKIVGRLSGQENCSALDWAELGRETVTWGQHLKSASQEVPEGPVDDALRAVSSGRAADPKASNWDQMQSELEDLLKKPDEKKQDQKDKDQKKDEDKKQDQDKKQDGKGNPDQQKDQQQKQQDSSQKPDQGQGKDQQQDQPGKPQDSKDQQQKNESAFGKMGQPTPSPDPKAYQGATQRVGGVRKDEPNDPARANPELAVPLEKLEQVKNGDSPAELFEMLRKNEPITAPASTGKNW
jgi:Ca-activated chloride channel family protein